MRFNTRLNPRTAEGINQPHANQRHNLPKKTGFQIAWNAKFNRVPHAKKKDGIQKLELFHTETVHTKFREA